MQMLGSTQKEVEDQKDSLKSELMRAFTHQVSEAVLRDHMVRWADPTQFHEHYTSQKKPMSQTMTQLQHDMETVRMVGATCASTLGCENGQQQTPCLCVEQNQAPVVNVNIADSYDPRPSMQCNLHSSDVSTATSGHWKMYANR